MRAPGRSTGGQHVAPRSPVVGSGTLVVVSAAWFALVCNGPFLRAALQGRELDQLSSWTFGAALLLALWAVHGLLLGGLLHRLWAKPLLVVLMLTAAVAQHFEQRLGVFFDPAMLHNMLATDDAEARELVTGVAFGRLAADILLWAGLPTLTLLRLRIRVQPWPVAVLRRAGLLAVATLTLGLALLAAFQDLSALMRTRKDLRYLINPANVVYSLPRAALAQRPTAPAARLPIGLDARVDPAWATRKRPALLLLVVGESVRAANWGLAGYGRQTTPELALLDTIGFDAVQACGTDTATSLPCMFAPVGRRQYNAARIRGSESLLHVLQRAGYQVHWLDNQSGCKGVCDGLPSRHTDAAAHPELCAEGHCLDETLLRGLDALAKDASGDQVLVLHMLGNHGPAYHRRAPAAFQRFQPGCDTAQLHRCSREQIVNSYDNAVLYTDHLLGRAVQWLRAQQAQRDTALVYVSDHGESLGEKGLYLHGMPYAMAPDEQIRVPMVWWLSDGFAAGFGLDRKCLQRRAREPASHDQLFHSLLGMLRVRAAEYEASLDLTRGCS